MYWVATSRASMKARVSFAGQVRMAFDDFAADRQHVHDRIDAGLFHVIDNFLTVFEERLYARISSHHLRRFAAAEKSSITIVARNDGAVQFAFTEHF